MDFTLEPEFDALREKTRDFIAEHILPLEADKANYD
ncbi:MAG: acyl-CoA dehydrogenase, partial [Proteobacteria bacterium]|nr:acyl-CoA dehydrogenase [Pseudomonadota bacterium]